MQAGKLRHRIQIQHKTDVINEIGGNAPTWATFLTIYANVLPANGREIFNAQQVVADVTHHIQIRRQTTAITPAHRIQHKSRTFEIKSVIEKDERLREQMIMAKEVTE